MQTVRDLKGYGQFPPQANWPGKARLALQIVLNYEEGGESTLVNGDEQSETLLADVVGLAAVKGGRHQNMESMYEYGSRVGVWRLLELFARYEVPISVFAVGKAVEWYGDPVLAAYRAGHEICSHSYRWIDYQWMPEAEEREHIAKTIAAIKNLTGEPPVGWYTGKTSPNTRRLVAEAGMLYDADSYADELPYWEKVNGKPHLVVPYTLDVNDMKFGSVNGFVTGDQFFHYLKDTFDVLYAQGATSPRMMSVGTHCRLLGRPGRAAGMQRFLEYVRTFKDVWICRRCDIARHWIEHHPATC